MKLALSIIYADFIEERSVAYKRLRQQLSTSVPSSGIPLVHIESGPNPFHIWSENAWRFVGETDPHYGIEHGIILQDDVTVCEQFWPVLERVLAARPDDIISFHCNHPGAVEAQKQGKAWITSVDGLVGNGYAMPRAFWLEFLEWRERELLPGLVEVIHEDTLIDLWAMCTGRLIWHTVPALIDHDVSLKSTWGNPHNAEQLRPRVPPAAGMLEQNWDTDALHVGRVYQGNHWSLLDALKPEARRKYRTIERAYELERSP